MTIEMVETVTFGLVFPPDAFLPPQSGWVQALDDAGKPFASPPVPSINALMNKAPVLDLVVVQKPTATMSTPTAATTTTTTTSSATGTVVNTNPGATTLLSGGGSGDGWATAKVVDVVDPSRTSPVMSVTHTLERPPSITLDSRQHEDAMSQEPSPMAGEEGRISPALSTSKLNEFETVCAIV